MFDVAWSELLVIGVVALIVIGPKELPGVLRAIGHWMGKIRRMASEFQGQFQEAMREAELSDLKNQVDDLNATATSMTNFDPMASAQSEIDKAFAEPSAAAPPSEASAADAPAAVPEPPVNISVPLPDPPSPVSESDFAPLQPAPQKQAGGGA